MSDCKNPRCDFERGHKGLCSYILEMRAAINPEPAINRERLTDASQEHEAGSIEVRPAIHQMGEQAAVGGGLSAGEARTPNRRDRKAYNDYMREYMRKYRARGAINR